MFQTFSFSFSFGVWLYISIVFSQQSEQNKRKVGYFTTSPIPRVIWKQYKLLGEEITENYGLMYTSKNFDERQQILLNHYKFECLCTPCIEKWSSLTAMSAEVNLDQGDVRMNRFQKIRCIKCGETIRSFFSIFMFSLSCWSSHCEIQTTRE